MADPICDGLAFTPRAAGATAFIVIFTCITGSVMALRLFTRLRVPNAFGADDAAALLAYVLLVASTSLYPDAARHGYGHHIWCLEPEQVSAIKLRLALGRTVGLLAMVLGRLAAALLILRIFNLSKWAKVLVLVAIAIQSIVLTAVAIANVLTCSPPRKSWESELPGKCWSSAEVDAIQYLNCAVSVVYDFVLAALPAYFIRHVQMHRRQKMWVTLVLSLGFLTGCCAIARTALVSQQQSPDFTYASLNVNFVATLEVHMALLAASIPTLRGFVKRHNPYTIASQLISRRWTRATGMESKTVRTERVEYPPRSRLSTDSLQPRVDADGILMVPTGSVGKSVDINIV